MKYVEVRSSLIKSDAIALHADGISGGFVSWSRWPPIESRFAFYIGIFGDTQNSSDPADKWETRRRGAEGHRLHRLRMRPLLHR